MSWKSYTCILIGVAFTRVLFIGTPCPAQAVNSGTQSAASSVRSGATCTFQSRNDVETYPSCVLQDGQGHLFIAKQYVKKLKFNSYGLAAVWDYDDPRHKFMYVDRKGRAVIQGVPISDNWAEEFSDGLVAIVVDEKYGFADRHGSIVITPQYDGAGPFENGYAVVCIGCREACIMPDDPSGDLIEDCEHRTITGGEWFKINRAGRVVASVPTE